MALTPDDHQHVVRRVKPGDLAVLHSREVPRVRVVLDVRTGSDGSKVVMLAPEAAGGVRTFLVSHVPTLAWELDVSANAVAG